MRHDAWSNLNDAGRDRLYKGLGHEDVQKMWSDEARAAALTARQHGYNESMTATQGMAQDADRSRQYQHPDGHSLHVGANGKWGHMESKGGQDAKMTHGKGAAGLDARLENLHHTKTNNDARAAHDAKLVAAKPNRQLGVAERHQHNIARQTLKYTPAMAGVMGGPNHDEARNILSHNTGLPPHPTASAEYAGQQASRATFDTMMKPSHTSKQALPGPRVIEVDGDQDSIAREYETLTPGCVTDAPEAGKPLMVPDADPQDYGETPLNPSQRRKSAGPQIA
jgi:hypothetical protein